MALREKVIIWKEADAMCISIDSRLMILYVLLNLRYLTAP